MKLLLYPRRRLLILAILALFLTAASAPTVAASERWWGELETPAGPLTLIVEFTGSDAASLSVPSRALQNIALQSVENAADGSVRFALPLDGSRFEGRRNASDNTIEGTWSQGPMNVPLTLHLGEPPQIRDVERAQTPKPPFPYLVEDITLQTSASLACTLTRPREADPVAGAVLLTVAGPNDRDQTHSGHKPYMVLADHLTRLGIAVLRCDDRGVGGSGGELASITMDDLRRDAEAMLLHLRNLGIPNVGLIGNSEGSVVASAVAAQAAQHAETHAQRDVDPSATTSPTGNANTGGAVTTRHTSQAAELGAHPKAPAFIVLLGGVGVEGHALIRARIVAAARARGATEAGAQDAAGPFDRLVTAVLAAGGVGLDRLQAEQPALHETIVRIATEVGNTDPTLPADVDQRARLLAGPWYYSQLILDGGTLLRGVKVPVLALTGSKDRTNLPDQNLPAIRAALEQAANPDASVQEMPGLNHVFQTAQRGGIQEYALLPESFAPVALQRIGDWILARVTVTK